MNCPFSPPQEVKDIAKKWEIPESELSSIKCGTATINGKNVHFVSHNKDDSIARFLGEIVLNDGYNVERMKKLYAPLVIDIGGNLGGFTIMAYFSNPTATIIACEPNPVTYTFFLWNLLLNKIPVLTQILGDDGKRNVGVMPIHAGATIDGRNLIVEYSLSRSQNAITSASSESGVLPLYESPGDLTRNKIPSVNIKSLLQEHHVEHITFLKIDCEGCEYEVLPSLEHFVSKTTFFAGEMHACKEGHACSYAATTIMQTKEWICHSFQNCCLVSRSFGAVMCGGMSEGREILGSHPYLTTMDVITNNLTSVVCVVGALVLVILSFLRRKRAFKVDS
jgi:FkbM family methyltransferase